MDLAGISTAILSALFMGTMGVFAKKIGLNAEVITFFRLLFGASFMMLFLLAIGQLRRINSWPSWPVLLNGGMLAGFIVFYIQAMEYTTMANAIMLEYLAPFITSIYAHYFLKERLTWLSLALLGLALFGFAMMMEFRIDLAGGNRNLLGIGFGILSMFCYASFILVNRIIDERIHVYTRTFYQLFVGALVMLPIFLLRGPDLPMRTWPWLVGTGLVPGFLAILCAVFALSRLPAATFSTLAYFEPITVIVSGWVLFGESLSWLQLCGCFLIIASGIFKVWSYTHAESIHKRVKSTISVSNSKGHS